MNFDITLLTTLQKAELRILTSILVHSIITAGKKEFLKKFNFILKKGFDFFDCIGGCYFQELVEIHKQVIFLSLIYKTSDTGQILPCHSGDYLGPSPSSIMQLISGIIKGF